MRYGGAGSFYIRLIHGRTGACRRKRWALHGDVVAADLAACGLQLRAPVVWAKQHFTLSRGDYHWKHETCWYAVREDRTSHWFGASLFLPQGVGL